MKARCTVVVTLFCLISFHAHAESGSDPDRARGQALAHPCTTCHGLDGLRQGGEMPAIGGLDYFDLLYNMGRFRSADHFHPVMTLLMQTLDEADMADIAAYFAGIDRARLARVGPYGVR